MLDSEGRQRLDDALGRGCRVQIGFTVDSFGNSEISLELISGDDRSKVFVFALSGAKYSVATLNVIKHDC
ncbi:MAG: hypothetical protein P1U35_13990 [Cycloclasticus sp.]|nr:hypothetical protein [Cycloclasticus sp.]